MTVEEYRQRMIKVFHNADTDELIAICVIPTEKEFEHLEWLLKNHYKKEPCEAISRQAVLDIAKSSKSNWIDNSVLFKRVNELPSVTPQPKMEQWIPVSNPQKELPKDRILWVTIDDDKYAQDRGGYYWMGGLVVTTIYWDMTEWSDDIADYVTAYMDYVEPMPYKAESEK